MAAAEQWRRAAWHRPDESIHPVLTAEEIERARRFGSPRRYAQGERLFELGKPSPGLILLLSGRVEISSRDRMGRVVPVAVFGPGQFVGELAQLSDSPALVDGDAKEDVEALVIPAERLRALIVAEAELGARIQRAFGLRRVKLIAHGYGGPTLIGTSGSIDLVRIQTFLTRNAHPHHLLDPLHDEAAAAVIDHYAPAANELPLVLFADGSVLRNPLENDLAQRLGMVRAVPRKTLYDVAVVGGGPAGLATAVYAASEGLSVVVLDRSAFGGQAGASMRIENYLGFAEGISGLELAGRAYAQAQKFGVEFLIPVPVNELECLPDDSFALLLDGGERVRTRSVVVATGARYRRPEIPNLGAFEGRGVWYWASPIEARLCAGKEVIIVGGGNSAGQAAVFLAEHAARVRIMIRGKCLAATMSRYLIDRIEAARNIEVMSRTEIVGLEGDPQVGLERVRWREAATGVDCQAAIGNVFVFVGAEPATSWLSSCGVEVDRTGFVITGAAPGRRPLESSVAGVFAVGDVRARSVKRVGGAIGEGAQVVASLHDYLAQAQERSEVSSATCPFCHTIVPAAFDREVLCPSCGRAFRGGRRACA